MDDLEREIKLVQLQRDRLALEREIASHNVDGMGKKLTRAIEQGGPVLLMPFRAVYSDCKKFSERWGNVIFSVVLVVGCIGAAVVVAQKLAEKSWEKEAQAYVNKACPEEQFACTSSSSYDCNSRKTDRAICHMAAWQRYDKKIPRP